LIVLAKTVLVNTVGACCTALLYVARADLVTPLARTEAWR
jgi:hypothetical protein